MDNKNLNFILGRGERLLEKVDYKGGFNETTFPYTFEQQKARLLPKAEKLYDNISQLKHEYCPNDQAVAKLYLHPQFLSRSHFPKTFLQNFNFRLIGSKSTNIKPTSGRGSDSENGILSTVLFIAGKKQQFSSFVKLTRELDQEHVVSDDFQKIEDIEILSSEEKTLGTLDNESQDLEIVIHFDSQYDSS